MPSGWRSSALAPVPSAIGSAPSSAAKVVIMIGRKRRTAARWIASAGLFPSSRCSAMATSTIMIAFFFTMPISMRMPISAITERSSPNTCKASSAPSAAEGRPDRIVSGWMKLS